jgi:hypothetical protein
MTPESRRRPRRGRMSRAHNLPGTRPLRADHLGLNLAFTFEEALPQLIAAYRAERV